MSVVLKFGGSSVADAPCVRRVAEIVKAAAPRSPVVVVSAMGKTTDALFAAAQAGDRAALERLLSQLRPDIQRYARFQCYASSSIEDVVQEALIVVYRRVGDIRSPAALGAWLGATMVLPIVLAPVP